MKTKTTLTRRVLALCMSVLMLLTAWVFVAPTKAAAAADVWDGTWDGSGFSNNHITSAKGFAQFINNAGTGTSYSGQTVYLDVDIDLNNIDFGNISGGKNVYYSRDNYFQGTFDGQGHTIYHFQMHNSDHRVGLFRSAKNATFRNVTVDGVYVDDNDNGNKKNGFAVMVGYGEGNLTFENVHIKNGIVYGYNYVGGLVGEYGANDTLRITNCSNGITIHADNDRAAGMVGHSKGRVYATNCSNTGEIYAGYSDAGGIAGWIEDDESYFVNCSNTGKVSTDACAGGIVGYFGSKSNDNKMTITGCSNTGYIESRAKVAGGIAGMLDTDGAHSVENNTNRGDVYGRDDAGGIVGSNIGSGTWRDNKNYGNVSCANDNAGGILGDVEDDVQIFYNCYNTGAVEGKNSIGGVLGYGQNANHEFYDCGNSGAITSKSDAAGGIFGYGNESEPIIEQCWNIGTVKAYNDAGGILGRTYHHSYIRRCWNAGSIETYEHNDNGAHGGIAGQTSDKSGSSNDNPNMTDCFNWGPVSGGRDDGGLIGKIKDGRTPYYITNSYNAGQVSGVRPFAIIAYGGNVGNNVYYNNNVVMGTVQGNSISDGDLKNSSGFSGNYCKNTWGVKIGNTTYNYPILTWYRNMFMFHLKFVDAPSGTNAYFDGKYGDGFYPPNPTRRGYNSSDWYDENNANRTMAKDTVIWCGSSAPTDTMTVTQNFNEVTDVSNTTTFRLTWEKIKQKLDMNAVLNGEYRFDNIDFFTADVYVNGTRVADDVNDFYQDLEYEDTYEITDIKAADGYRFIGAYDGIHDGRQQSGLTGQMDIDLIEVAPEFKTLHTVTVTPGTGTTITGAESGIYAWGDKVTVTATAETGYDQSTPVLKVNGNVTASGSEITITGDTTITTDALQLNTYTINFYNGDPDEPYATRTYTHGEALVAPENPTFSDGTDADYRFVGWAAAAYPDDGWDTEVTLPETVTANANYYSLYDGYVTVTWKNGDVTLAGPASAMVGTVPVYDGETPTTADAQYTYTAIGWNTDPNATTALDPLPKLGTSNVTYYAVYDKNDPDHRTVNKYTITWKNWDGSVLATDEVEYGATPVYSGPAPTRANDAQYTYGAYHWDPMIAAVSGEATYTAQFDYTVNAYTVTWKNWDGTVLETDEDVSYGTEPHFDGETPTRDADSENHYVFAGWDDDSTVKGDKIITATFTPAAHVFDQQNTDAKYLKSGATCTAKAQYYYSCSCGYKGTETFEYGEKLEHSFTHYEYNNDATCTADGTETAVCDYGCGETDTRTAEGTKLIHSFTHYKYNNDATCNADGTETATCDHGCGETDTRTAEGTKLSHSFTHYEYNNDATCNADGTETATCDHGCGETDTRTAEGTKLTHSFTHYEYNNDATCTADGTETATCDHGCGETDTRTAANTKLTHSFTNYVYNEDATCDEDGTETATCDHGCGTKDTRTAANTKLTHSFTNYVYNEDATCDEDGTETATCDHGCGETDTRAAEGTKLSHSFTHYEYNNDATCNADGTETATCDHGCGETDTRTAEGTKLTHSFTHYEYNNDATCNADGTETATCDHGCGETDTRAAEGTKLEHTFTVLQSDATGHWYKCANCDATTEKEAHTGGTATCTEKAICEVCDAEYGELADHDFSVLQSDATGHWYKCANCDATTAKAAHTGGTATCTEKAKCEVCETAYGELLDHDFTVLQSDADGHWYKCANCDATTEKEAHKGGTASCTEKAKCEVCNTAYGDLLAHDFTVLQSDATGHWYKCANCDATTAKEAHTGGTATCTEKAKCEVCDTAYGDLLAHDFTVLQSDATDHWYKCANCDATTAKEAHTGGTATCTEKATCEVCETVYGNFDYTNHSTDATVKKNEKAAGYTFKGYTGDIYCAACDHLKETGTEIDKLKLSDNETVQSANEILAAEEAAPGTYDATKIAALEDALHDLETLVNGTDEDAVLAKIEQIGNLVTGMDPIAYVTVTFTVDGETVSSQTIKAGADATAPEQAQYIIDGDSHKVFSGWTGDYTNVTADVTITATYTTQDHTWTDGNVTKAATCMATGTQMQTCVCGATHEKTLAKDPANHTGNNTTAREDEVPATCTAAGSYVEVVTCECGAVISRTNKTAGNALGHSWGDWVITKNATCTEEGVKTRTCARDAAHTETQAIAKKAHVDNNGDGKCDVCGSNTDVHQHTDANGDNVCDNCGKTINTSFRCSMCDYNDQHRNTPVFGWFVIIVHFFVHLFAQMKAWV